MVAVVFPGIEIALFFVIYCAIELYTKYGANTFHDSKAWQNSRVYRRLMGTAAFIPGWFFRLVWALLYAGLSVTVLFLYKIADEPLFQANNNIDWFTVLWVMHAVYVWALPKYTNVYFSVGRSYKKLFFANFILLGLMTMEIVASAILIANNTFASGNFAFGLLCGIVGIASGHALWLLIAFLLTFRSYQESTHVDECSVAYLCYVHMRRGRAVHEMYDEKTVTEAVAIYNGASFYKQQATYTHEGGIVAGGSQGPYNLRSRRGPAVQLSVDPKSL